MLIAVAVANRHITGVAVVGVGLLLNLVAVAVNGGMPVRASALEAAGVVERGRAGRGGRPAPPRDAPTTRCPCWATCSRCRSRNEVLSFGDLIVIVGAADAVRELSRRRARSPAVAAAQRPTRTASASVDQVWGTAPSGAPVSATQCSANPERSAPATIDLTSAEPAASDPELVAASQSR